MPSREVKYALIYWGAKGGGHQLFNEFIAAAKLSKQNVIISARPLKSKSSQENINISLLNIQGWLRAKRELISLMDFDGPRVAIIVMTSPWDLFLGKRLMKNGIEVIRIIHDGQRHPGDFFPPNFWLKFLTVDCSSIVVLSDFVSKKIQSSFNVDPKRITVMRLPIPRYQNKPSRPTNQKKKILLIGRGKRYQGQKLLEKAWDLMDLPDVELTIAGRGFRKSQNQRDIYYLDRWLTDEEVYCEISSSDLVVLPYIEASQSGIVPICISLGIPVLVTPVGGLPEQVSEYSLGSICKDLKPHSLAEAMENALKMERKPKYSPTRACVLNLIKL
jgi:glycosyltransferase involved in cell wall biosynthesis